VALIGSHGALASLQPAHGAAFLDEDAAARLKVVRGELEAIRSRHRAVRPQHKPSAVVLHTRGVEPLVAAAATTATTEVGVGDHAFGLIAASGSGSPLPGRILHLATGVTLGSGPSPPTRSSPRLSRAVEFCPGRS
jgi:hypothetical protein